MSNKHWPLIVAAVSILMMGGVILIVANYYDEKVEKAAFSAKHTAELAATRAFVRGACGGNLAGCERLVVVTAGDSTLAGGSQTQYVIQLGRVYRKADLTSNATPSPVLLGQPCTGYKLDVDDPEDSSCDVQAL